MAFGPATLLPAGTFPFVHNYRQYIDGVYQPRPGLIRLGVIGTGIHSLFRLNDGTVLASHPAIRVVGAGTKLYAGFPGGVGFTLIDSGWSGTRIAAHPAQPLQAAQPWLYLADSVRMRKVNANNVVYQTGIAAPVAAPGVAVAQMGLNVIDPLEAPGAWSAAGTAAGAPSQINRVNTSIAQILYDSGTSGYASVSPTSALDITVGTLLEVGPSPERVLVTDVLIAIASTTIQAILYDQGNTGLCTIQPVGSLGTGQLEAPDYATYADRNNGLAVNTTQDTTIPRDPSTVAPGVRIRQVDFPVNCLITLNSGEVVRILSIAVGQDGIQSFRCSTNGTHAAGETITGLAGFRAYFVGTYQTGALLVANAVENVITPSIAAGATSADVTGGIQSAIAANMALINGRATLPDDDLHLCVRVDRLTEVNTIRVYFDVDASAHNFLQNYLFFEWRANDIIAAVQGTNAAAVDTLQNTRTTTVINSQLNQPEGDFAAELLAGTYVPPVPVAPTSVATDATSEQLGVGNNQWVDLRCKISDLIPVGTDTTRTLANVQGVEILINATATAPLTIDYHSLWISGGFGADVGATGIPYVYRARYRSTITGVKSTWSPPSRGGVNPRRQRVLLSVPPSADPQVDKVDWARFGGALPTWTYDGTSDGFLFNDDFADGDIVGGETIVFTDFQPWPTADLPRKGFCSVAGSAVQWVSGDQFNATWAPGSTILVNGFACTLYASPSSPTTLQINENVGASSLAQFYLPDATLQATPLPTIWGDYNGYHFAVGDPNNPATLYWSNPQDLDSASDANTLVVSDDQASEPLQNGFIWDAIPYVFSTQDLYRIVATPGQPSIFNTVKTACGRGLWSRFAFVVRPEGTYFVAQDGIGVTAGGSPSQMITGDDLRLLFPKDGASGQAVTIGSVTIQPPNMAATMSLSGIDGLIYFDYYDINGVANTLVYDPSTGQWLLDRYICGVQSRLLEEGSGVHDMLIGGDNGIVYQAGGSTDDGTPITWLWATAPTTHGSPGYLSVHDAVIAHQSLADFNLIIAYDGVAQSYTVPNSGGLYERTYGVLAAGKGLSVVYGLLSTAQLRVFKQDSAVRVQPWGRAGGYAVVNPFGGANRRDGEAV